MENCVRPDGALGWEKNGGFGNVIIIEYNAQYLPNAYQVDIGIKDGQSIYVAYAHLSQINVYPGGSVTANQVIGLTGDTGNSTGPHLHVEVRIGSSEKIPPGALCTPVNGCWGNDNWVNWRELTLVDPDILFPEPHWNRE